MDAAPNLESRAGRPKAAELEQRADALLAATEALLVKLGYERTTLNAIAKSAGVSKQTIYAKYGGKPGLLRAVLHRMSIRSLSTSLGDADDLPLYEGLLERARRLIVMMRTETAVAITTISEKEARKFPEFREEMIKSRERNLLTPLSRHFDNLKQRGLVKDIDSQRVAAMFLWAVSEEVVEAASTGKLPPATTAQIDEKAAFIARFFTDATASSQTP